MKQTKGVVKNFRTASTRFFGIF